MFLVTQFTRVIGLYFLFAVIWPIFLKKNSAVKSIIISWSRRNILTLKYEFTVFHNSTKMIKVACLVTLLSAIAANHSDILWGRVLPADNCSETHTIEPKVSE